MNIFLVIFNINYITISEEDIFYFLFREKEKKKKK